MHDILKPKEYSEIVKDLYIVVDNVNRTTISNYLIGILDRFYWEVIDLIKDPNFNYISDLKRLFEEGCKKGHLALVKEILKKNIIDPSENNNFGIRLAYHHDQPRVIELLLLEKSVIEKLSKDQYNHLKTYSLI